MQKIIFPLFLLFALPAYCQGADVRTEIVTIALDEPVDGLFFHNGEATARLQANPTGLGEPLKYSGPRRLLLRTTEAEFSLPPPLPPAHASIDLPPDSDRVLLACLKSGDAPVKFLAYDIGKARIGAGEYRFFNFSRSEVAVNLGGKKLTVKSGGNSLVSDPSWKQEVGELDIAMAMLKDGKTKPVYSSQWGNRPGRRNYIFLFDGPRDYQPIRITRFFDVPPAADD